MPNNLKVLSGQQIAKILNKKFNFNLIRQTGSYLIMFDGNLMVVVPNHKVVAKGTLKTICKSVQKVSSEEKVHKFFYTD